MYTILFFIIIIYWFVCKYTLPIKNPNKFYLITFGIIISLISGLRHNMGTDYLSYQYNFEVLTWGDVFRSTPFFNLLQMIVKTVFGNNIIIFMTIVAGITIYCQFRMIYKYSNYVWLSVLLLLYFGSYFTSYNTTRIYLAISIYLLAFDAIQEKNFNKYCIFYLISSCIHFSLFFLLPCYFFRKIKYNKYTFFFIVGLAVCCFAFSDNILKFINMIGIYDNYAGSQFVTGNISMFKTIIRPLLILMFYLFFLKTNKMHFSKNIEKIFFSCSILTLFFSLISVRFYILYRYTYVFLPYSLLGITYCLDKYKLKGNKNIIVLVILTIVFVYSCVGQFGEEFLFFWQ